MRVLFIGDIVGKQGRRAVELLLGNIIADQGIDFTIANGENAAGGMGLTPAIGVELFGLGVDVITSGNHIWAKKEIFPFLEEERRLLRPLNYPEGAPGRGWGVFESKNGLKVGVLNLEGRVFMKNLECPFRTAERAFRTLLGETKVNVVDFHAEASSEKMALGWFLDGKASMVVGTHTHVQTGDERILEEGTAYITDAGMTGPMNSVIGVQKQIAINRFLTQLPFKHEVASDDIELQGVVVEIDSQTGRASEIQRLKTRLPD
jgi:2',3'-cyclic-nucleotide 2'-phosphodiesterase